ncbi:MAG: DUF554 domain-containing protein [Treponema sp.]|jgi:uncharacterized membrane protein YqgA involved in biofilm formation|nr:DUF554 domain-containing protein [Treponema sp.]
MLGPVVNALVVVACALAGCFLVKGIPERFEEILKKAIALAVIYVGIKGALDNQRTLLLIMSMVLGALIGELCNIDRQMNRLGRWVEGKLGFKPEEAAGNPAAAGASAERSKALPAGKSPIPKGRAGSFSRGFVSASILFCTGSMAIVGSMQSGLLGNHEILFAKSILDGAISIVFGASMGIGVVFSALPVLFYQGAIALASMAIKDLLTPEIIREMSAVGSLLVAAIGFNFLNAAEGGAAAESGVREIRVANLIPAIFIPWVYIGVEGLFKG